MTPAKIGHFCRALRRKLRSRRVPRRIEGGKSGPRTPSSARRVWGLGVAEWDEAELAVTLRAEDLEPKWLSQRFCPGNVLRRAGRLVLRGGRGLWGSGEAGATSLRAAACDERTPKYLTRWRFGGRTSAASRTMKASGSGRRRQTEVIDEVVAPCLETPEIVAPMPTSCTGSRPARRGGPSNAWARSRPALKR